MTQTLWGADVYSLKFFNNVQISKSTIDRWARAPLEDLIREIEAEGIRVVAVPEKPPLFASAELRFFSRELGKGPKGDAGVFIPAQKLRQSRLGDRSVIAIRSKTISKRILIHEFLHGLIWKANSQAYEKFYYLKPLDKKALKKLKEMPRLLTQLKHDLTFIEGECLHAMHVIDEELSIGFFFKDNQTALKSSPEDKYENLTYAATSSKQLLETLATYAGMFSNFKNELLPRLRSAAPEFFKSATQVIDQWMDDIARYSGEVDTHINTFNTAAMSDPAVVEWVKNFCAMRILELSQLRARKSLLPKFMRPRH